MKLLFRRVRGGYARSGLLPILGCAVAVCLLSFAASSIAEARSEVLRWTHPQPSDVAGFEIYVGTRPAFYDLFVVDAGLPTPDVDGVYTVSIDVPEDIPVWVAVSAYSASRRFSRLSNERVRSVPLGVPGRPVASDLQSFTSDPTARSIKVGSRVRFEWLSATGAANGYRVRVRRSGPGGVSESFENVGQSWGVFAGQGGESISVRVAAVDVFGNPGVESAESLAVELESFGGDRDNDGVANGLDNCPGISNPTQVDADLDGVGNPCDNCAFRRNSNQRDLDGDQLGDPCDNDADGDGLTTGADRCPFLALPANTDSDGDGIGDACDPCATMQWSDPPVSPPDQQPGNRQIVLTNLDDPGHHRLRAKGRFNPVYMGGLPIDPSRNGVAIKVEDLNGVLYSISLPGGARGESTCDPRDGWTEKVRRRTGISTWRYVNRSGSIDWPQCTPGTARGIRNVVIKDRAATKGRWEYVVRAKDFSVDTPPFLPVFYLAMDLTLAAAPDALQSSFASRTAQCAEARFLGIPVPESSPKPYCKVRSESGLSGAPRSIICRGQ